MLTPSFLICRAGLILYEQFPIVISSGGRESRFSVLALLLLGMRCKSSDFSGEKFKPMIAGLSSSPSLLL
jgi:hypothetical protein